MDIQTIGNNTLELVKEVGNYIRIQGKGFSRDMVEQKSAHDFVSYVDKTAEQKLVDGLRTILPESGFLVEENTASHSNEEYIWIIDPLDGTTNFIHQLAPFSISVALQHNEDLILGVIYEIATDELFYSWGDTPVFCNGEIIKMSGAKSLADSLISTGFPVKDFSRLSGHLKSVEQIVLNSHGLRRHGSAATDLAFLASGRTDGFFEYGLNPWDIAAGIYLVKKNGGLVCNYTGGEKVLTQREICAANPGVMPELLQILKSTM